MSGMGPLWTNVGSAGQTWQLLDGLNQPMPPFPVLPGSPVLCVTTGHMAQSSVETGIKNCEGLDEDC